MIRYHLTTKTEVISFDAKNEEAAHNYIFGLAITRQVSREEGPDASGGYTVIWRDGAQELKRLEFAAPYDPENAKAGEMITEKMIAAERVLATSLGAPLCIRVVYGYQLNLPHGWRLEEAPALGEYEPDLAPAFKQFLAIAQADLKAAGRVSTAGAVASAMRFTTGAVTGAVNGNHSRTLDRLDRWCRIWNALGLGPEIRVIADSAGVRLERAERGAQIEVWNAWEGEPPEVKGVVSTREEAIALIQREMKLGDFGGVDSPWEWELRHPDGTVETVRMNGDTREEV